MKSIVLVMVLGLAGCSFFVTTPRPRVYGEPVSCQPPRTTAIIDTSVAVAAAGTATFLWYDTFQPHPDPPCTSHFPDECPGNYDGLRDGLLAIITTGVAVLYTAAATAGWYKVHMCSSDVAPDDRPGYAAWLNRAFAGTRPPMQFSASGPDATTLVVVTGDCGSWLDRGDLLAAAKDRGFKDMKCVPAYLPAP